MKDPIKDGAVIFEDIAEKHCLSQITEPIAIQRFLEELFASTRGLVIVDFLDTANWDHIQSFEFDAGSRDLKLVWRDDDIHDGDSLVRDLRREFLGTSASALAISVQTIRSALYRGILLFAVNGYFASEKDVRNKYKTGADEIDILRDDLFKKTVFRRTGNRVERIDVHTTPIYSIAILPKNCYLRTFESRNVLFWLNLQDYMSRLDVLRTALQGVSPNSEDEICGYVMAARRLLEFVLKLECCHQDILVKNRDYNKLELGHLVGALKEEHDSAKAEDLSSLVRTLNDYSHTSGAPVDYQNAVDAIDQIAAYTRSFHDRVG